MSVYLNKEFFFLGEESHVRSVVDSRYVIEDIGIVNRVSGLSHKGIYPSFVLELEPISREMCVMRRMTLNNLNLKFSKK